MGVPAEQMNTPPEKSNRLMVGVVGVLIVVVALLLFWSKGEFLLKLRDIETARGLITFLISANPQYVARNATLHG